MKLQLALDTDLKKALVLCKKTSEYIDIIELGTPLIKQEGLKMVKKFKKFKKPILADLKTMDVGFYEAEMAFKDKADIITVCGTSDIETIKGAIKSARKRKKKVLVDLIAVKDVKKRARELIKLRPHYICIHTGIDLQKKGKNPLKELREISKIVPSKKIAVAGGVDGENISKIVKYKPEIIIIGGAITKSRNPEKAAKKLKEMMK